MIYFDGDIYAFNKFLKINGIVPKLKSGIKCKRKILKNIF